MFFIKQVLPIVLLSMGIGFAVTWYNWKSDNKTSDQAGVELAENAAGSDKTAQTKPTTSQKAIQTQARPNQPIRVVQPPRTAKKQVQPVAKPVTTTQLAQEGTNNKSNSDFISSIESEINTLKSSTMPVKAEPVAAVVESAPSVRGKTAGSQIESSATSSQHNLSGWSADSFLNVMNPKKTVTGNPQDKASSVISQVAKRSEQKVSKDPYLDVLQDEATDLSVTAVDTAGNKEIIRNQPSEPVKARQEAAKQEAAKLEAAKLEAAKLEAAKLEAAKQEAAKQEAAKQEAAKQEAAKQAAAKQAAAKQAAAKQAAAKQAAAKQAAAKQAAAKQAAAKQAAAKQAAAKQEAAKQAAAKQAAAKQAAAKQAAAKQAAAKQAAAKQAAAKQAAAKQAAPKVDKPVVPAVVKPVFPEVINSVAAGEPTIYIVKEGDSLTSIASDIYGNAELYLQIFEANRDVLNQPDEVVKGMQLKIPER